MSSHFDYPATINKFRDWTMEVHNRINTINHEYTALKKAKDTGEGDPNTLILTPAQLVVIGNDMAVLEAEIEDICSAHDVEPVEIPD